MTTHPTPTNVCVCACGVVMGFIGTGLQGQHAVCVCVSQLCVCVCVRGWHAGRCLYERRPKRSTGQAQDSPRPASSVDVLHCFLGEMVG